MFFASHYSETWFESWSYKWYTGFTITSYPPLVHQIIALLSKIFGLKLSFILWGAIVSVLFVRGAFHFSKIWVSEQAALVAAFAAVFSFSFVEALHVFGQLPSLTGASFLLNACPEIHKWFVKRKFSHFLMAVGFLSLTTAAHHVTTIFGMVFFVLPVMATAIMDRVALHNNSYRFSLKAFLLEIKKNLPSAIIFGVLVIILVATILFPYWYWSKTDPITQIPIPHGSRGNFFEEVNLGIVFFLIPWALMLLALPYFFIRLFKRRNIFLGLSFALLFVLGTGGTTPIPKMLLGETAFNILTLDRFTFWATLIAIPFWGEFLLSFFRGDLKERMIRSIKMSGYKIVTFISVVTFILSIIFIINLNYFKPLQPKSIDIKPIANFLNSDQHNQWRYLTLGFGDQMAWLSANTDAYTVDGNYHSVRRLPELTSRAVERIENSKYLGLEGLGALQQFLTVPNKYNLKYIFSNDKFYEPLLFFSGWNKINQLENNIIVWERPDVPKLSPILPKKSIPKYQSLMWGTLPLASFVITILIYLFSSKRRRNLEAQFKDLDIFKKFDKENIYKIFYYLFAIWAILLSTIFITVSSVDFYKSQKQISPENCILNYFKALDIKEFDAAHGFFNPETRPSIDQYRLELSLEDGILASFAKLDSLDKKLEMIGDTKAKASVSAYWITSLMAYTSEHEFDLTKIKGKWYIEPQAFEKFVPADKFISKPSIDYYQHGRRKAVPNKTFKEDILDRPNVFISDATLVKKDQHYTIVGQIKNIDNVPAYLSIEAILYNEKGEEITRYNAKDAFKNHLSPKEFTPFRIDFESIAKTGDLGDHQFNPDQMTEFETQDSIVSFSLFVKSIVSSQSAYKNIGIQNLSFNETGKLKGEIHNYGTDEINIPQILVSYFDENSSLFWLDKVYYPIGIRPQRKKSFEHSLTLADQISIISKGGDDNLFVNGVANKAYLKNQISESLLNTFRIQDANKDYEYSVLCNSYIFKDPVINN